MRFRNTLIALVVLLILGGYAFVNTYFSKPEPRRNRINIKADEIAKIELKYPDRDLVLERDKGKPWMHHQADRRDADQTAADNLARAIADCADQHRRGQADNLAPFGLDKPRSHGHCHRFQGQDAAGDRGREVTPVGFSAYPKYPTVPQFC